MRGMKKHLALGLAVGLILGIAGLAAAAQVPAQKQGQGPDPVRLEMEVRLLKAVNTMQLTQDQTAKVLDILKAWRKQEDDNRSGITGLLQKERALLLKPQVDGAGLKDIEKDLAAKRKEAQAFRQKAVGRLEEVLNARQAKILGGILRGRAGALKARVKAKGARLEKAGTGDATAKTQVKAKLKNRAGIIVRYETRHRVQTLDFLIKALDEKERS